MSTATLQPMPVPAPPLRWTRERYYLAIDCGIFDEDEKVELIAGQVLERPMPQKEAHANGIGALQEALGLVFARGYWLRIQLPLAVGQDTEPEPDLAVVEGSFRDYSKGHPSSAVLVAEVADSSVIKDRRYKASLFASAGIEEYWILNLAERQLEVHREPFTDREAPFGYKYSSVTIVKKGGTVNPVAAPARSIAVADLLP